MTLAELIDIPMEKRDFDWEQKFLKSLPEAKVKLLSENAQMGPDNFPYLMVEVSENGTEPIPEICAWLASRGIGLAINPHKQFPDFVLTYGMTWSYQEYGEFQYTENLDDRDANIEIESGEQIFTGEPSPEYLPQYVRDILKQFLAEQGILSPRVLMLSQDNKNYDMCFSLESLGSPKEEEHEGILKVLSWFLPSHYSIAIVGEEGLPEFFLL